MSTAIAGDFATLINQYLSLRRVRGLAENSCKAYRADLQMLAAHVARFDVSLVQLVSERMVNEWLDDGLLHHGWSKRSAARRLASTNAFFSWLIERELVTHHPSRRIRLKFRNRQVIAPELPELKLVIAQVGSASALDIRDRAILLLMLDCALRVSEVAGLDAAARATYAVAEDSGRVYVRPKGGDDGDVEVVGMEAVTVEAVRAWRGVRHQLAAADEPALFVNTRGGRLSRQTLYHMVRNRGSAAGQRDLHPHLFRHRRIGGVTEVAGLDAANALARHKHKSTTINVYGAHAAEVQRQAIRTLAPLGEIACNG